MKKTLVLGASLNPSRYSYLAINRLVNNNHEIVAIGLREGNVAGIEIIKEKKLFEDIVDRKNSPDPYRLLHRISKVKDINKSFVFSESMLDEFL